jgi:hypothetical protein
MDQFLQDARRKLLSAINSGELVETDLLAERVSTLTEVVGCDSLDLIEFDMHLEEQTVRLKTVRDLRNYLEGTDPDGSDSLVVKK